MPRGGANKYTRAKFIELAEAKFQYEDGSPLYDYTGVILHGQAKITIGCRVPKHETFEKTPARHLSGQGCPKCSLKVRSAKRAMSLDTFKTSAIEKHGAGRYDYSEVVYVNNRTDVKIGCVGKNHKPFYQIPEVHLRGNGCPACGFEKTAAQNRLTTEEFTTRAREVHGDTYSYLELEYLGYSIKVRIICSIHGGFYQSPGDHLAGRGCSKCGRIRTTLAQAMTRAQFILRAVKKHGEYGYSKAMYVNIFTRVIIICETHGEFTQTPHDHLAGHKCPSCRHSGFSKLALEWLQYKSDSTGKIITHALNGGEHRIPGTKYTVDGYIKSTNTVLEFHGDYWHGNPKLYSPADTNERSKTTFGELHRKTIAKREMILGMGYKYEEIWESDWLAQREEALAKYPPYEPDVASMIPIEIEDDESKAWITRETQRYLRSISDKTN